MESVTKYLTQKLRLKVNAAKSKIARPHEVKYLGFSFYCIFKEKRYKLRPHRKSVEKLKEKLRALTRRSWGVSNEYKIKKINEVIRGWTNYFRIGAMISVARRRRFRMYIWKHWKNPSTRYKHLVKLGVSAGNAAKVSGYKGYARVCRTEPICFAISNARLERFGLLSMEKYFLKVTSSAS